MRWIERLLLAQHLLLAPAQGIPRIGEEQAADGTQLLKRITAASFTGLVAVGPFIVPGCVDERTLKLLKQVEDCLVISWVRAGWNRRQAGSSARLAAGVDVPDVRYEAHLGIRVDRID